MSFFEDLKAYIDGELSEERTKEVAAALESDPALRAEYEGLRALSSQIQGAVRQHPIAGLEETLSRVQTRGRRHIPWKALGLSAAAIAVVAVAIPMLRSSFASDSASLVAMSDAAGEADTAPTEKLDLFELEAADEGVLNGIADAAESTDWSVPGVAGGIEGLQESDLSGVGDTVDGIPLALGTIERTDKDSDARAEATAQAKATADDNDAAAGKTTGEGGAKTGGETTGGTGRTGEQTGGRTTGGVRGGAGLGGGGGGFGGLSANAQLPRRLILTVANLEQAATAVTKKLSDLKIETVPRTRRTARVAQPEKIFRLQLSQDELQKLEKELAKIGALKELTADQTRRAMSLEFKQAEHERAELEQRLKDADSDEEKQKIQSQLDRLDETSNPGQAKPGSITVEIVLRLKGDNGS